MHQMDGLPMMVSGRRINITERGSYIIRMVQYGKGTFDNEAPDEELIYSNLATASLLASDKISLEELFAVDDSDTSANTTQTVTAENGNTAASIQSDAIPPEVSGCEKDGTWQKILVEATGSNAT